MWLPEGGELAAALVNAIVLALWAALPVLILGYVRQAQAARRIRPEFSLRKSEIAELDRAVALYDQICRRLKQSNGRRKRRSTFGTRCSIAPATPPMPKNATICKCMP